MKDNLSVTLMYTLTCTKEQLTLINKALTGNLRPEEVGTAKELGLTFMDANVSLLQEKTNAAQHAFNLAKQK